MTSVELDNTVTSVELDKTVTSVELDNGDKYSRHGDKCRVR